MFDFEFQSIAKRFVRTTVKINTYLTGIVEFAGHGKLNLICNKQHRLRFSVMWRVKRWQQRISAISSRRSNFVLFEL